MVISLELATVFILFFVVEHNVSLLILDGSTTSYAKFPKWPLCRNSSISFEFTTRRPDGLLYYVELQGKSNFVELKLVSGTAKLHFNYGTGAHVLTVGEDLQNGKQHSVMILLDSGMVLLAVDNIVQTHRIHDSVEIDLTGGYVYFGGLPISFVNQIDTIAVPFVLFETRFQGSILNVVYSHCGSKRSGVQMLEASGIRSSSDDICAEHDPCQNGGACISTDVGVACECSLTYYMGTLCEKERILSEVTLFGHEYLGCDLRDRGSSILSNTDEISLQFRTNQPNALLFYSG